MHESEKWKRSRSVVSESATPWTAAHQAPLSMGFSRQQPSLGAAQRMCWLQNSVGHTLLFFHQLSASKDEQGNFSSRWHFVTPSLNFRNSNKYWKRKLYCWKILQYCTDPSSSPISGWNFFSILSSVQFSRSVMSDSLRPHESQQARPPWPSLTPRVYANSCP